MIISKNILVEPGPTLIAGSPQGFDALILAELAQKGRDVLFVARDDVRAKRTADALAFFAPNVECLSFPAWDCLPYDRVSPLVDVVSQRIDALTRLLDPRPEHTGRIVLSTVSAVLQRVPPGQSFAGAVFDAATGDRLDPQDLVRFALGHGYTDSETVMEPGELAVRGGILDIFPPGRTEPVRLDFFGDEVEAIRTFDPASQRTSGTIEAVTVKPVSEVPLDKAAVTRFRSGYRTTFGAVGDDDPLYVAVSAGRRHIGFEHWLPLFHERLETLFDYMSDAVVVLDHQAEDACHARLELIEEYFEARRDLAGGGAAVGTVFHPLPPDRFYLGAREWTTCLGRYPTGHLSPFAAPEGGVVAIDAGGRPGWDFTDARVQEGVNVFDVLKKHIAEQQAQGRCVIIAAYTEGSRDRLSVVLAEHGVGGAAPVTRWGEAANLPPSTVVLAVLGLERGFVAPGLAVIGEQDVLGERLVRSLKRRVRPETFIAEASAIGEGDLVVHADHGIGRFDGLTNIQAAGAPHDCLRLIYDGGDKLFLPVENIEVLSRYGSEQAGVQLDRLGGAAWQARKARLARRIRDMADELIKVAAARALRPGARLLRGNGMFDEFCAGFPYVETDDQARAIEETLDDLGSGHPMDRLICGDVGFGKTEVALRAAFVTVMAGKQVAVVVPTTLLARQHHRTFKERFADQPVRVEQLSRLVPAKHVASTKAGLADGTVDIVIGTHALLAKSISFRDLGLLVVDEEQHFGVAHKERLKKLKTDVHILTLTATPIPRTLQMALTGVRELSLMATPPVDRLAVRTFILPDDPVVVREAIVREHYRGGQTFYVCPRIEDLDGMAQRLRELVPEVKLVVAHGRMAARALETVMSAFYDGSYDVLLSTHIIESGLDLPSVNTIIIHRAEMFGLSQLYQLRGRVGRAKVRAYAYLILPVKGVLSTAAQRRLEVMQTLDSLGAGFSLASHDLDVRGAGNLLGEEQSGHIREVGLELYQQMLEEAVSEARGLDDAGHDDWSPQIGLGIPVLIPESYVADLGLRLALYRRLAALDDAPQIDAFAAEMIDRFGALPAEVENLLQTVAVKQLCRRAGIDRMEAGPKGAVIGFRQERFANPGGLVDFITSQAGTAKLRPDHKLVYRRDWNESAERLAGARHLIKTLAEIACAGEA